MRFGSMLVSDVFQVASAVPLAPGLERSIEPVSEISEAWDDEFSRVQFAIDDRRENLHRRMRGLDGRDSLRRGDDANQADVLSARSLEHRNRRNRAAAGRE